MSFQLSDILMFSREVYLEVLRGYGEWIFPWSLLGLLILILSALILFFPSKRLVPLVFPLTSFTLVMAWGTWGWLFFGVHYHSIAWYASWLAWACGVQFLLMLGFCFSLRGPFFSHELSVKSFRGSRWIFLATVSFPVEAFLFSSADVFDVFYLGWGSAQIALISLAWMGLVWNFESRYGLRWLMTVVPSLIFGHSALLWVAL